jgi:hypothetical protein
MVSVSFCDTLFPKRCDIDAGMWNDLAYESSWNQPITFRDLVVPYAPALQSSETDLTLRMLRAGFFLKKDPPK